MWAYLFWTVVVVWLFSLRPKRDEDSTPRISGTQLSGHDANANLEISTTVRREQSWGERSQYDTPSERGSATSTLKESTGSHRQRDLPPHLDRSFTRSISGSASRSVVSSSHSSSARSMKCYRCGDHFVGKRELLEHKLSCKPHEGHPLRSGFRQCEYCDRAIDSANNLAAHMLAAHPEAKSRVRSAKHALAQSARSKFLRCGYCGRAVDSANNLAAHMLAQHPEAKSHVRPSPHSLECDICGRVIDCEYNLRIHKLAQHRSESVTSKPEQSTAVFEDPVWSNVGEEACDICETQFEDEYQLNQHKGVHHAWFQFCSACSLSFDATSDAMQHYSQEHGAKNVHPQRIQAFMDNLRPQDDADGLGRVFSCERCGEEFPSRTDLKEHYENPFAHGNRDEQSSHFPPLPKTQSVSHPRLQLNSIDTSQQLPSFGLPCEGSGDTTLSSEYSEWDSSAPAVTESVHNDSIIDSRKTDSGIENDGSTSQANDHQVKVNDQPPDLIASSSFTDDKQYPEPLSSSDSEDDLFTPQNSMISAQTQPYIPVKVADIETQVPSFSMPAPGKDSFPDLAPGPLPAPAKAPVSAWSKPLLARPDPPPDRPFDVQTKRFDRAQIHENATNAASQQKFRDWHTDTPSDMPRYRNGRYYHNSDHVSKRSATGPRQSWAERAPAEPKPSRAFDTAAYRARHPEPPVPEVRRGLEPIWDSTEWEVISDPVPQRRADQYAPTRGQLRAQEERFKEDLHAKWAREAEERDKIKQACVEAGEDDPYGGW